MRQPSYLYGQLAAAIDRGLALLEPLCRYCQSANKKSWKQLLQHSGLAEYAKLSPRLADQLFVVCDCLGLPVSTE